jgi:hypothetical protein
MPAGAAGPAEGALSRAAAGGARDPDRHRTIDDDLACNVETGRALAKAGLHPATGGDGSLLCSGDMLLDAPDADDAQLASLLKLTERYCVVLQTLRSRRWWRPRSTASDGTAGS